MYLRAGGRWSGTFIGILHLVLWPGGLSLGPFPLFIILKGSSITSLFRCEHFPDALFLYEVNYEKTFFEWSSQIFQENAAKIMWIFVWLLRLIKTSVWMFSNTIKFAIKKSPSFFRQATIWKKKCSSSLIPYWRIDAYPKHVSQDALRAGESPETSSCFPSMTRIYWCYPGSAASKGNRRRNQPSCTAFNRGTRAAFRSPVISFYTYFFKKCTTFSGKA